MICLCRGGFCELCVHYALMHGIFNTHAPLFPEEKISIHLHCLSFLSWDLRNIKRPPCQLTQLTGWLWAKWGVVLRVGRHFVHQWGISYLWWWLSFSLWWWTVMQREPGTHAITSYNKSKRMLSCKHLDITHRLCVRERERERERAGERTRGQRSPNKSLKISWHLNETQ